MHYCRMFDRIGMNSLFMVTLIDYLNTEQNGSLSSATVIFQITVCALLSFRECSAYFTSFFPGKGFATENKPKEIFCVNSSLHKLAIQQAPVGFNLHFQTSLDV